MSAYAKNTGKIAAQKCSNCGDVNVGTVLASGDFACGNCDRESFEAAAEAQKESWLAGEDGFDALGCA
jgi:hypothetical protein